MKFIHKRALKIEKRLRFVISVGILSCLMLISTFFFFDMSFIFIPLLIGATYFFIYFSLIEWIKKVEWFGLFFMPVMLSLSFYFFYFLFPGRWLTRLPFIVVYAVSLYALLLCSNIFNVRVEKSLQLYRAAFSVNFFYQAVILFLLLNTVFSFKFDFLINGLVVGILTGSMSVQLLWTIRLKPYLEPEIKKFSFLVGLLTTELSVVGSFAPLNIAVFALFVTSVYYSVSGIIYHHLDSKLFKETIREYVTVLIFVFVITLLSINW